MLCWKIYINNHSSGMWDCVTPGGPSGYWKDEGWRMKEKDEVHQKHFFLSSFYLILWLTYPGEHILNRCPVKLHTHTHTHPFPYCNLTLTSSTPVVPDMLSSCPIQHKHEGVNSSYMRRLLVHISADGWPSLTLELTWPKLKELKKCLICGSSHAVVKAELKP